MDVGIDALLKHNKLAMFKDGPVFWVDSADSHPCIGKAVIPTSLLLDIIVDRNCLCCNVDF